MIAAVVLPTTHTQFICTYFVFNLYYIIYLCVYNGLYYDRYACKCVRVLVLFTVNSQPPNHLRRSKHHHTLILFRGAKDFACTHIVEFCGYFFIRHRLHQVYITYFRRQSDRFDSILALLLLEKLYKNYRRIA